MAVRIEHGVEIAAPIADVWRAFCEADDWPRWFPTLHAVERARRDDFILEERIVLGLGFRGHRSKVRVQVFACEPDRSVRWKGRSFGVTGDHEFRVEEIDAARSRFVSDESFSGLPVLLLPRVIWKQLEREVVAGLDRFRALIETRGSV